MPKQQLTVHKSTYLVYTYIVNELGRTCFAIRKLMIKSFFKSRLKKVFFIEVTNQNARVDNSRLRLKLLVHLPLRVIVGINTLVEHITVGLFLFLFGSYVRTGCERHS